MVRHHMKIDVSPIKETLRKTKKKDPALFKAVQKKINQIAELNAEEIQHFKNLRKPLNGYKRVHVKNHVPMFKLVGNTIIFGRFAHHDEAYE